jgi:hypothetical protein
MAITVRAKSSGFLGTGKTAQRIRKGAVFTVASESDLAAWMERLEPPAAKVEAPKAEPVKPPAKAEK